MSYRFKVLVQTVAVDEVDVIVNGSSEGEAYERASKLLSSYPRISGNSSRHMPYLYIDNRDVVATDVLAVEPYREEYE